mmetsp:Transcript_138766/g.442616  ORF Transcript_138766/g.442616 Transcript_138766/m.442616 type:complete len:112 (-) Transcript_138766:1337-1672(-)
MDQIQTLLFGMLAHVSSFLVCAAASGAAAAGGGVAAAAGPCSSTRSGSAAAARPSTRSSHSSESEDSTDIMSNTSMKALHRPEPRAIAGRQTAGRGPRDLLQPLVMSCLQT